MVLVASLRALKMHGGLGKADLGRENVAAVRDGLSNLGRHLRNLGRFGVPATVAINRFGFNTDAELAVVRAYCTELGVEAFVCTHWADGGAGTEDLAHQVVALAETGSAEFRPLYEDGVALTEKARIVARDIYEAEDIGVDKQVADQFAQFAELGFGHFPVCMAKTQYSFTTDPNVKGAPSNHVIGIRELRLAGGAEFVVAICGEIMTMPGLPRVPAANSITVNDQGEIEGLF